MSDDTVTIEVDGQQLTARKGAMLIEATDAAGITVPRFCYHNKLSIAANCRMCLVEVEKAPKPLPACATPVMDGMKVFTKSERAIAAQRGTMEFLLINHPLDCPICDQGGECELQDVAMGYGEGVSRYTDTKRVVFDKDIGPLISTEMTRCIHCTRCVRFGDEVAGLRELGATGRGEDVRIGTYVEQSVVSELSGNVIDLCPVGALTAKPSRYTARPWELRQHAGVATHDCVGSNVFHHTRDGEIMRTVPRENAAVNEVWISDRDRFSYEGLRSKARLQRPMIRDNDTWLEVEWDQALDRVRAILRDTDANDCGYLASPGSSLEELFLVQKLARAMGCGNVDHRLRQHNFEGAEHDPVMPWLGQNLSDIEAADAILVVGGNPRKDQPMLGYRIRQAALAGAKVSFLNVRSYAQNFDTLANLTLAPEMLVNALAGIAGAAGAESSVEPDRRHQAIAESLQSAERPVVLVGSGAQLLSCRTSVHQWAHQVARHTGAKLGFVSDGANAGGAWLAGCVPHRLPGGASADVAGLDVKQMLSDTRKVYVLHGVDEFDFNHAALATSSLKAADSVIALTAYDSDALRSQADILLPLALASEIDGTYVNVEGRWQFAGAASAAPGESRAGWKILRVLADRLGLEGFDYFSAQAIRGEVQQLCADVQLDNEQPAPATHDVDSPGLQRISEVPIYAVDALVRHAASLQRTADAISAVALINSTEATELGLTDVQQVKVEQKGASALLPLVIDDSIPDGCVWIPLGAPGAEQLGPSSGPVSLSGA